MISDDKIRQYAIKHPEENMVQLFSRFDYPIPRTKEEFEDPKFNASFFFERDEKGNIVPIENIYWKEKYDKNFQNPMDSFYSLLEDQNEYQREKASLPLLEEKFKKSQKRKIFDKSKSKNKVDKVRKSFRCSPNKINDVERKTKIYKACLRHYSNQLNNKLINEITLDNITNLGQIYYIIKTVSDSIKKQNTNMENDNNILSNVQGEEKKELYEIKYISSLIRNSIIAKNKFGPFSWVKGDSQIIGEEIGKIKLETQSLLGIKPNNILFDENTLFLLLKGKRIKYDDVLSGNQNYFKFLIEEKLIPSPIKVKFYSKCCRDKIEKYHSIMDKIKINEELLLAFAFNPTYYFDNYNLSYQNNNGIWEYVYYIDSSKAGPRVEEIFNEITDK
jgi:hypothetical protein